MMTLDFVAQRYGKLPSELLQSASSLDIIIADAAAIYQANKQKELSSSSDSESVQLNHGMTTEQMLDLVNKAKG